MSILKEDIDEQATVDWKDLLESHGWVALYTSSDMLVMPRSMNVISRGYRIFAKVNNDIVQFIANSNSSWVSGQPSKDIQEAATGLMRLGITSSEILKYCI